MIRLAKPWIGEDEQRAVAAVLESGTARAGSARRALRAGGRCPGRTQARDRRLERHRRASARAQGSAGRCRRRGALPCAQLAEPRARVASPARRCASSTSTQSEWNSTADGFRDARSGTSKVAIVIDQFGNPARAAEIRDALGTLPIIEDAACALGSRFANGPCGSLGEVSCLSFHPRKILTTGEGGMCLTDDDDLADKLRMLRNHGQLRGQFVVAAGNSA